LLCWAGNLLHQQPQHLLNIWLLLEAAEQPAVAAVAAVTENRQAQQ
jgi:hypothetical protein